MKNLIFKDLTVCWKSLEFPIDVMNSIQKRATESFTFLMFHAVFEIFKFEIGSPGAVWKWFWKIWLKLDVKFLSSLKAISGDWKRQIWFSRNQHRLSWVGSLFDWVRKLLSFGERFQLKDQKVDLLQRLNGVKEFGEWGKLKSQVVGNLRATGGC
jgi:hypothetical protein